MEYKVNAPGIEIDANYARHSPRTCLCKECHELAPQSVHNSIDNAFDFVKGLRKPWRFFSVTLIDLIVLSQDLLYLKLFWIKPLNIVLVHMICGLMTLLCLSSDITWGIQIIQFNLKKSSENLHK